MEARGRARVSRHDLPRVWTGARGVHTAAYVQLCVGLFAGVVGPRRASTRLEGGGAYVLASYDRTCCRSVNISICGLACSAIYWSWREARTLSISQNPPLSRVMEVMRWS
eukprot:6202954-Pleurochrysis_carterae.AAC.1